LEIMEAINRRRSIRSYRTQPVEEEKIIRILKAAHAAPSASNYQPWYFIVVKDHEKKRKFAQSFHKEVEKYGRTLNEKWQERLMDFSTEFVLKVPVILVVCADAGKIKAGEPGRGQHVLSTCAAIQNLMLAAVGEGLGTVWITRYNKSEIRSIFNIPSNVAPVGVIPLGYPEEIPEKSAFALAGWVPNEPLGAHVFEAQWGSHALTLIRNGK